ncbi:MAG: DUF3344 domain-containing protein, partial [Methanosarcinales archaeon]|nr:DUF3344 domain-containing protein [Methanosarcinales archaeon]
MKVWYLLIGLMMLCAAGTGAIQSSVGFPGAEDATPPTPFLVFGHVWYEGGSPCNSPIVNINSNDTSWQAETRDGYGYYELILNSTDVISGVTLSFNATDGAGFNITNHTVNQSDLDHGGVFGVNLTLEVPPPTTSQPRAPFVICGWVNYTNGAACDDLSVNISGWQAETRDGYNYYELIISSADVGPGDALSFNAIDGTGFNITNHTVSQSDLERGGVFEVNLTLESPPPTTSQPRAPFAICGWVNYENGVPCDAPCVNITNLDASAMWQAETRDGYGYYELILNSANVGIGDLIEWSATDDIISNTTNHTITESDLDRGGVFDLNLTLPSAPPISEPSAILVIYGNVPYKNGTPCDSPFVVVTNSNTSEELIADNRTGESFYQLATSSAFAEAGDVLKVNASKNGTPVGDVTHIVNRTEIEQGAIEVNLNQGLVDAPDFIVTDISFNPSEPLIGDLVAINATILNAGAEGETYVEFYDNKSIFIMKNATLTLPGAIKMRVYFPVFSENITIYNKTGVVERLIVEEGGYEPYWTKWCDGGTIRIEGGEGSFQINRYEALLGNKSITLGRGNSTNVSAVWNLSDQYMGWATNGTHDITVRADHYNQVIESDETNNNRTEAIDVNSSLDFAVTNISFNNNEPVLGDLVEIDATISNYGVGNGTAVVEVNYYNTSAGRYIPLTNKTVTLNGTESTVVSASWQTGAAYGGVGNHTITVKLYTPDALEANETNNILSKQLFVNGTDLTVTAIEIPCGFCSDNFCYLEQNVSVTATIANIGAADATDFTVRFRDDAKTGEHTFNETHIERLNSSETMNISVVWKPNETYQHTIAANISHDKYTENNGDNNELSNHPYVESRYDFLVESVNVEPQKDVRRGESVNITATIGNIGHVGANVSIAFFVNSTDFAGTCGERFIRFRTLDYVYAKVGENKTVSITWDVDVVGGSHLIAAVVNPDNEIEEIGGGTKYKCGLIRFRGDDSNNVKNCTLHVIPNNLNITDLTLDPAEPNICEVVDVSADIRNNMDTEAESTVRFYMEKNVSQPTYSVPSWSTHQQPEDAMIRVHFDYIKWGFSGVHGDQDPPGHWTGEVMAYVNGSYGQRKPMYFYYKDEAGELVKVPYINKSMPCTESGESSGVEWMRWYDVWTEWSYGDEIEISMSDGVKPCRILIDRYQVRLGNEIVTLRPGESMVSGAWNASPPLKAGEYYRLMASVDDQKRYSEDTYLGGTDLAVTNLSVTPVALGGDRVWINATIESLGMMDATDFIVNVSEVYRPEEIGEGPWGKRRNAADHPELIDTTHVEGLDVGNSINISVLWNASIRDIVCDGECFNSGINAYRPCYWTEIADDYIINITINPLESTEKEENNTNNTRVADVHVDSSRDFEVTDLSFYVNNESHDPSELVIYDDLTLNATLTITNNLNKGGSVNVSFYIDEACDEHEIGNVIVTFPAGDATRYAEIEWKVESFDCVDIPGDHNITVVADPENRIYEIDDVNNTYMQPVHVGASDLLVERIEINPESPVGGETASINVTLRNHGDADANDLILKIYDWAERHIEDVDEQCGVGCEQMVMTRDDATAMRLYLDLEVEDGGRVCIKDNSSGREIVCYDENFHGWAPWVLDNSTAIVVTDSAYIRVRKVYYLLSSGIINTSTHDIGVNNTKKITVDWNASTVGERFIAAIVDPEDCITESNEFNNRLVEFTSVQTADLLVSNLSLTWLNGTEIGENDTIKHGDDVRISANLSNIGVEDADSFNVRFFVDDILIKEETISGLANGSTISRFTDWSATVGSHLIRIEVDYENEIDETNETNNIVSCERYVCGPELSGNTSWETSGLHGDILFEPDQPYDEDEVNITATINNSGYMPAENFSAALFFDYKPSCYRLEGERRYDGAVCVYLNIVINSSGLTLTICDGAGNEVKKTDRSCWVQVPGDVVDVSFQATLYDDYKISPYPVYPDNLSQIKELGVDSSVELPPITHNVSARDYPIMLFIDPEGKVPEDEDHRADNIISRVMHVKPTRDFTVTNVTGDTMNLSDLDAMNITACVSNIGLRNGTDEVTFVDSEEEMRTYKYHFNPNQTLSYLPITPDARLLGLRYDDKYGSGYFDNLMIIHRPGVGAIDLHFNAICPPSDKDAPVGRIGIFDENGSQMWYLRGTTDSKSFSGYISVPGETAYICTNNQASFDLDRYITKTEFHRKEVRLNASKTWNESKNITSIRTAYTGNHTIAVTLHSCDEITEIDESNNEKSSLFSVNASREPVIVELNVTPEHPDDGDDVDITAVITNDGTKVASFTFDLWANTTQDKGGADVTESNLTVDLGDRIRYIRLLNHSDLTLAPGENMTIQATWNDISGFGYPRHRIIAIVDPLDEIDEANESNNEIDREIVMNYPDFSIGGSHVPGGKDKAMVTIKEIGGACSTPDVTVRFVACEEKECKGCGCYRVHGTISEHGASNIQVHFDHLSAMNGHVEVRDSGDFRKDPIAVYSGVEFADEWGPWVNGSTVYICCWGAWVEIDKYRWGNVSDEVIEYLPAGKSEHVEMPWTGEYREPYDLNVTVDPDNNITELDEDNNNETIRMGADIAVSRRLTVTPPCPVMGRTCTIKQPIRNIGNLPTIEFNVTLYMNATNESNFEHNTTINRMISLAANEEYEFSWDAPEVEPPEDIEYDIRLVADPEDVVKELRGDNNEGSTDGPVKVYSHTNYTGWELFTYDTDWVYGNIEYTIGDSKYEGGTWENYVVHFEDVIPENIRGKDVKLARLYLYWTWGNIVTTKIVPVPIEVNMEFNGITLNEDMRYVDYPHATSWDVAWGTYTYEIPSDAVKPNNHVVVDRTLFRDKYESDPRYPDCTVDEFGIFGVGLLVIYEDDGEGVLTNYWINEGGDVIYEGTNDLGKADMRTTAIFEGEVEDEDMTNATLWTVTPGGNDENELYFNKEVWEDVWSGNIGIDNRSVTEYLIAKDNTAELQYISGNSMMSSGAFLFLRYPPDLNIINLTAPASTVVGAHHSINATIRNDGRSDAHDFNATLEIDGRQMVRIPHLDLPAGENMTLHLYNWTPMTLMHVYNLTAAADVLSGKDWTEIETDNNAMTKHVSIEE